MRMLYKHSDCEKNLHWYIHTDIDGFTLCYSFFYIFHSTDLIVSDAHDIRLSNEYVMHDPDGDSVQLAKCEFHSN